MKKNLGPSTRSVHLNTRIDPSTRALVSPLNQNVAFVYDDLESWRAVAIKQVPGYIYSRNSNPTTSLFEEKVAALEGAQSATSFATGMGAVSSTLFALLEPGKRAVTVRDAYGGTFLHFTKILPRFGIKCEICDTDDYEKIEAAINKVCDVLYLESPTNPTLKVLDLARLCSTAHSVGAVCIVDNTFATPINQQPIALGADLVIHSATKFLGGHGDVMGGVVCGRKDLIEMIYQHREITGPSLDPHSAFLLLRSLKTLGIRIERHNQNALSIAQFLAEQPQVSRVYYPGLESHPGHQIATRQMSGYGGVLSFELKGGYEAVSRFLPRLHLAYMAANLGQVETIAGTPATTSHVELSDEERLAAGVPEGLIRYSAGIEDFVDLRDDISRALKILD